jgi:hypothetical protein
MGGNTTSNQMPRLDPGKGRWDPSQPDQNSGEQIMFEGLAARFRGSPSSVSANSVVLNGIPSVSGPRVSVVLNGIPSVSGPRVITVVSGRGLGQSRVVESIDTGSGTVTLATPWKVLPDGGSVLSIGNYLHHIVAYQNRLDGRPRAASEPLTGEQTASAGFQAYGGAFNLVVSDNYFSELKTGIYNWSVGDNDISPDYDTAPPNYFNLFQNNTAVYCYNGFSERFYCANKVHGKPLSGSEAAVMGNIYRNNRAIDMVNTGFSISADYSPGYVVMNVFDQNAAVNSPNTVTYGPDDGSVEADQVWVEPTSDPEPTPPSPGTPPDPVPSAIAIDGPAGVDEGGQAQFTCTVSYSDGTTAPGDAAWSVDSPAAAISASGLFSAGSVDADETVVVQASFSDFTATHAVVVRDIAPALTGIEILGPYAVDEETTTQFSCRANYSDGSSQMIPAQWSVAPAYASIDASGLLTAGSVTADQSVTLTAAFNGISQVQTVLIRDVPPVLTGLMIQGPSSVDEGTSAQYTCIASYSDGTSQEIPAAWAVSGPASINSSGLLTASGVSADQTAVVAAVFEGISASRSVIVRNLAPALTGISIQGPDEVEENSSVQFRCIAGYADGSSEEIAASWSVDSTLAAIDANGILGVGNIDAAETVFVSATFNGQTGSIAVTLLEVGPRMVYPLAGFDGKTIKAELWDETERTWRSLGESISPDELIITDLVPDRWYWLEIYQYNEATGGWDSIHGNWIRM